jgi:hypothetical protein
MGFDATGSVQQFDEDGDLSAGGAKLKECFFVNFARLLDKDEIKKGSFQLELGVSGAYGDGTFNDRVLLQDTNADTTYKVNSPAGEYGILYATNTAGSQLKTADNPTETVSAGLLFYQAGVAVVTGSIFGTLLSSSVEFNSSSVGGTENVNVVMTSSISGACDGFRHRMYNLSFNNTTELNSTIFFCRANNNDFNYSSNVTYLSASKLRVKNVATDLPVSYITTVGLYSVDNELLAVAKLSEPLKKDPTKEFILKVRLDY